MWLIIINGSSRIALPTLTYSGHISTSTGNVWFVTESSGQIKTVCTNTNAMFKLLSIGLMFEATNSFSFIVFSQYL